jgi:hypothetical protein
MNEEFSFEAESPELFGEWESYGNEFEGGLPRPGPLPPVPWGGLPGPSVRACAGLARPEVIDGFDFDVDRLKPAHHVILQRIAACVVGAARAGSPITSIRLVGHTDRVGTDAYNQGLGQRRAVNARAALEIAIRRLDPALVSRIAFTVETRGEREPVPGDRARSRRVQIFVPPVSARPPVRTGCPPGFTHRLRLHFKILVDPDLPIATMLGVMQRLYRPAGILVEEASRERLRLPTLEDLDLFGPSGNACIRNDPSAEQVQLFSHRNHVGPRELAIYFVRYTTPRAFGCASHPAGRPGAAIAKRATRFTLAHEVGHVLGLPHVNPEDCSVQPTRLMTGCGTNTLGTTAIFTPAEMAIMRRSTSLIPCGGRISSWS